VNVDDDLPPDEQFASVLAAWDEALAAGAIPGPATGGSGIGSSRQRLVPGGQHRGE